jgi:hypothetical protein
MLSAFAWAIAAASASGLSLGVTVTGFVVDADRGAVAQAAANSAAQIPLTGVLFISATI